MRERLTEWQDCQLRVECAKMVVATSSRLGLEKEGVIDIARKIYNFVVETTERPPAKSATG